MTEQRIRTVDLFCGCGGFSLGAHAAGLDVELALDIDPVLTSSFAANFPKTKLALTDLSQVDGRSIAKSVGHHIDGVFGGPPCQGFSDIGRRDRQDPRRQLVSHFFRIVKELQPTFFIMENVRGLGYSDARDTLDLALDMVARRYHILGPLILDASSFGAATTRPRLFVLGLRSSDADPITLERISGMQLPAATVRDAIGDLVDAQFKRNEAGFDYWKIGSRGRPSNYVAGLRSASGEFTGHNRTSHSRQVTARFRRVKQGEMDKVGRHPRLTWDGQCPTLRAGTGQDRGSYQSVRPIHPDEPRVITVREAARIQGFPDDFLFHPTLWHSFRMIGNSVSPIMSYALFKALINHIRLKTKRSLAAE